jgi:branched-chain amino acid aminotransferase
MRQIWLNGKILPETEAKLSVYDSAFMFGDTVFEMTRSFNGIQFRLREHLTRLIQSAKYLRIPLTLSIDDLEYACYEVIEANDFESGDEHRLMINVTRGTLGIYKDVEGASQGPNVIITDFPLRWTTAGMGKLYDTGINCASPSQRTIPASLLEPKVKNRNRIHYLMANIEVSRLKGENNWALLLDPDGFIAEGAGCNFFIVEDGFVVSPEPRNILLGISRDYVKSICLNQERNLEPYDVYNAEEAFVTATPFCMLPVVSLNGVQIGDGKPGPLYTKFLEIWSDDVGVDIKKQIQDWDNGSPDGVTPYGFK